MSPVDYVIVGVFFLSMLAAGVVFYKWVANVDDFYVAGRQLTPFILAATLTATNVNLYSFVSQAGKANSQGIGMIWQTWTGNMALVIAGLFVIPVLRRLKVRTVPEFLEMRYGRSARMLIAGVMFLRLAFWLGIVLTIAVVVATTVTGMKTVTVAGMTMDAWHLWIFAFAIVTIVYTGVGGMWSVALTDCLQFIFMMVGALIVLPLIMSKVGWWPGLKEALPDGHLTLVRAEGQFNWLFMISISLLGIQWASTDQGMIQRAFGARDTRTVAKGMVLAGIITTPFALLWILPGLASRVYLAKEGIAVAGDQVMPVALATLLGPGVLGLVLCGMLASQMSTLDSNLSATATLFVNDIYGRFHKKEPDTRKLLAVARIVTFVAGGFMIVFAYIVRNQASTVDAYLWLIAILDMPLFVIVVLFGFLSRWANLPGALIGYAAGAAGGFITLMVTAQGGLINGDSRLATFASGGAAIVGVIIGSLFGKRPTAAQTEPVQKARSVSQEEIDNKDVYHIWPISLGGKIMTALVILGFVAFLFGALIGRTNEPLGSIIAPVSMIVVFIAGLVRLAFD